MPDLSPLQSRGPRRLPYLLGGVGFLAGLLLALGLSLPRVVTFRPAGGSQQVSAMAPVQIGFNRAMDGATVEARLTIEPETPGEIEWQGNELTFRPQAPWPAGVQVTVQLSSGARSSALLPTLWNRSWSFQIGSPRVIYLWPASGPSDLYVQAPGSTEPRRLTQNPQGVKDYSLGNNATSVAYSSHAVGGGTELRLLDLLSGEDRLIMTCSEKLRCESPALSPQGDLLAYVQVELVTGAGGQQVAGPSRVWAVGLATEATAIPIGLPGHNTSSPFWSPVGWLAYYDHSLRAFVVVDARVGPEPQPFTYISSEMGAVGSWSPDGQHLLFPEIKFEDHSLAPDEATEELPGSHETFHIHLVRVEVVSGEKVDLSEQAQGTVEDASPAYSPDGQSIAFARKFLDERLWTLGRQIWIMRVDGSSARQLTIDFDFNHSALAWSPDGRHLVYMRFNLADMSQPAEIWAIDSETREAQRIAMAGYQPAWIP